jgi:hypothetical protein
MSEPAHEHETDSHYQRGSPSQSEAKLPSLPGGEGVGNVAPF